ncbi:MAG: hypothetical protein QE271_05390 [Bacteriovoracaceae bacterium]|nr:hypothetical protein [Bacteriovoracaceae bacterium]
MRLNISFLQGTLRACQSTVEGSCISYTATTSDTVKIYFMVQ